MSSWKAYSSRTAARPPSAAALVRLFGGLFAVCSVFAITATVYDYWVDAQHARWPSVAAVVESGAVDRVKSVRSGATTWHIRCLVQYRVDGEQLHASLRSQSRSSREYVDTMEAWVKAHRRGSVVAVHYNPERPAEVVSVEGQIPYAGSHVHDDVTNAVAFGAAGAMLLLLSCVLLARLPAT